MIRSFVAALVIFAIAASAAPALATTPPAPPSTKTVTPTTPAPPRPEGTPWPAPSGLTVVVGPVAILNPDNSFISPDQRTYKASATWELAAGFSGRYEVEIARRSRSDAGPLAFVLQSVVEASTARDGTLRVEENTTFLDSLNSQFCFRVRTVTGSSPNTHETGPYAMACSVLPPSSGGTPPLVPLPPVVGSGNAGASGALADLWAIVAAGAVAVFGAAGLGARRMARHKIHAD